MVIVIALIQFALRMVPLLIGGALDPLDYEVFQSLFGKIMTLLIALEFKHSIIRVAIRRDNVIQVKTVILIALLALSCKFVILDISATNAATIAALAGATLVLGVVYWLLRERDDRLAPQLFFRMTFEHLAANHSAVDIPLCVDTHAFGAGVLRRGRLGVLDKCADRAVFNAADANAFLDAR